ncbi:MAG: methyltransferase, TIGR04325 family, partial [Brevinematales bacterium]|nr:methyltransferase, TIGR04325 family [Brevinematales bacterium]
MNLFKILNYILPPFFIDIARFILNTRYGWHGNYQSWEEAKKDSTGYDIPLIVEKVRNALLKVKNGEAVHERDSVLFDEIEYSWPLLAGLLLAAVSNKGKLSVLDFGGSLGSTYFQNRRFLTRLPNLSWNIVEQKHFVEEGKKYFEDEKLHFYYDIEECLRKEKPNVLLLSSVLQYLEKPYDMLAHLLSCEFPFVIVDRTPFNIKPEDRITVQRVPPWIYEASYPCWLFNEE